VILEGLFWSTASLVRSTSLGYSYNAKTVVAGLASVAGSLSMATAGPSSASHPPSSNVDPGALPDILHSSAHMSPVAEAPESDTHSLLVDGDDDAGSSAPPTAESTPTASQSHYLRCPSSTPTPSHPPIPRALSMPDPSLLASLRNPIRHFDSPSIGSETSGTIPTTQSSPLQELPLELANLAQLAIQIMLPISPPHVFEPAKEQVSACALSVPIPSVSGMFTLLKKLNYISANMATFCLPNENGSPPPQATASDFDIGEMLQNVADAVSGAAAHAGVELVLFHGDVALKHIWVGGDEGGMAYLLSHVSLLLVAFISQSSLIFCGVDGVQDHPPGSSRRFYCHRSPGSLCSANSSFISAGIRRLRAHCFPHRLGRETTMHLRNFA
jgi:osomolarity two-component system, response regulator SSK1